MSKVVEHLLTNQVLYFSLFFAFGGLVSLVFLRLKKNQSFWKKVDLVWVVIGGTSVLTALLTSSYLSGEELAKRSIDSIQAEIVRINRTARIFERRHCQSNQTLPVYSEHVRVVCDALDDLERTTNSESKSSAFASNLSSEAEYGSIICLKDACDKLDLSKVFESMEQAPDSLENFEASTIWGITRNDPVVIASAAFLLDTGFYQPLAADFIELDEQLTSLEEDFDVAIEVLKGIQEHRWLLVLRFISLSALATVLPLRVGKSVSEISKS